jgi:formylglycine-generating enzyme required for sulfatase activity
LSFRALELPSEFRAASCSRVHLGVPMPAHHTVVGLVLVGPVALAVAAAAGAQDCVGDLNGDHVIDGADLGQLLAVWGPCESCSADTNANGVVDGLDLGVLLGNWGECITVPEWATMVEARPDPAIVTDPALRAAIVTTGLAWRVRDTATQVEMLLVPSGTFQMGCVMGSTLYGCTTYELPVHQVTLTTAFYLGRYEVTQAQWTERMAQNPSAFAWQPDSPNRPVEQVSWNTIQGYLRSTGFRLPTEAEWEFACRAGTQTPFHNGSTDDNSVGSIAWYDFNSCESGMGCGTRPVGGKLANALGFHDMLGNVWEWVDDGFGLYAPEAQTDPTGPARAAFRVIRGGSWLDRTGNVRSSYRDLGAPGNTANYFGFRVARDAE